MIGQMTAGPGQVAASLLWAACRPEPDTHGVRAAVAQGADLDFTADVALAQRVAPLLVRALNDAGLEFSEEPWYKNIDADAQRCRAQAVLVRPRMADTLLEPLAAAGLEPLFFKGAALAPRYPAPGLRPMDDIDFVLPAEQHPVALEVLRRAGWRLGTPRPGPHHEVGLVHPEMPGLPIELHHAFSTWRRRSSGVSTDELWRNRRPCRLADGPAFCLPPEHELIAVVAHAARPPNVFGRLLWFVDIAAIASTPVDWDAVGRLADAARCRTAVAVALTQAARLGVDSPAWLRQPLARGTRLAALEPLLSADWPTAEPDPATRYRLGYALVDDRRLQLTFFAGEASASGVAAIPVRAAAIATRAVRRWWQLRRRASDGQELEQPIKP